MTVALEGTGEGSELVDVPSFGGGGGIAPDGAAGAGAAGGDICTVLAVLSRLFTLAFGPEVEPMRERGSDDSERSRWLPWSSEL
jgi:hypothetical protein